MAKYIELAKKLKELADKGVGGERMNAQQQLHRLMEKHGFTIDDIESETEALRDFFVSIDGVRLYGQIVATVLGQNVHFVTDEKKPMVFSIVTTASIHIEIQSKFDFYYKLYSDELRIFFSAFVGANGLFPKDATPDPFNKFSWEQMEEQIRIEQMKKLVKSRSYRTQIQ